MILVLVNSENYLPVSVNKNISKMKKELVKDVILLVKIVHLMINVHLVLEVNTEPCKFLYVDVKKVNILMNKLNNVCLVQVNVNLVKIRMYVLNVFFLYQHYPNVIEF